MKALKIIVTVVVIILAVPLVTALFIDPDYSVEREITIQQPREQVFEYLKYLKNQDNYSKWALMDPNMEKTYRGTDGEVGFVSAWNSTNEEVGVGEQEIVKITPNERIDFELRFFEPFESTEAAYMITEAIDSTQTLVKWGFNGHMDYPMNFMLAMMDFEQIIGDDLSTGLGNLKNVLED